MSGDQPTRDRYPVRNDVQVTRPEKGPKMLQLSHPKWTPEAGLNAAAEALVINHRPLAKKRARDYAKIYSLDVADLEGAALLGLMEAAKRFDAERGFAFATYAQFWIRNRLNDFRDRNAVRHVSLDDPVGNEDGTTFRGNLMPADPHGAHLGDDGLRSTAAVGIRNVAEETLIEEIDQFAARDKGRALLRQAIDTLNYRESIIVKGRHGDEEPQPLATFAQRFNVSVERARQIEAKAIKRLIEKYTQMADETPPRVRSAPSNTASRTPALKPSKDDLITRNLPAGVAKVPMRSAVTGRFTLARETGASRPAYPSWGIGRQFDHIVAYRRHLEGAPTSNTFEARVRTQIAQTQKRTAAEQAERRGRHSRAIAAGLSWAVKS